VRLESHSLTILFDFWKNRIAVHPKGIGYASGGEDGFVRVHHFDDSYYKAKPYGDTEIID
jgi:translation initiation factor 3 subunit I